MMNTNELQHIVFQTLLDFCKSMSLSSTLPFADIQETTERLRYTTGVQFATFNGLIEKNKDTTLSDKTIDEAIDFYHSKNLPFLWWSQDPLLEAKGFQFGGTLKGIAADINKTSQDIPLPSNIKIQLVQSPDELSLFTMTVIQSFGMDPSIYDQFYDSFSSGLKSGTQLHYLAYLNGLPVSTATLSTGSQIGIWNTGTLPEYRRQGTMTILLNHVMKEAKNKGQQYAIAVLMPKGMAWSLFQRNGFEEICDFPFHVYGVNSDELEK